MERRGGKEVEGADEGGGGGGLAREPDCGY